MGTALGTAWDSWSRRRPGGNELGSAAVPAAMNLGAPQRRQCGIMSIASILSILSIASIETPGASVGDGRCDRRYAGRWCLAG